MILEDLLEIPIKLLTEEQLREKLKLLRKLQITFNKKSPTESKKNKPQNASNKNKRITNLIDSLSEEDILLMLKNK